jgi:hypothetical protein
MFGKDLGIPVAELVQQPGRPLDVREEERDVPVGSSAMPMMRRLEPKV